MNKTYKRDVFATNLREYRKKRGLTQKDFCDQIGISQPVLSAWESGAKKPNVDIAYRVAKTLGVPLDALFCNYIGDAMSFSGNVEQSVISSAPVQNVSIGTSPKDSEIEVLKKRIHDLEQLNMTLAATNLELSKRR